MWIQLLWKDLSKIWITSVRASATSSRQTTGPSTRPCRTSSGRLITVHKHFSISRSLFHNQPWFSLYRKNILRFLDPERDISIQKGTLKPGDIIHYVLDRHSTTNISETLYRLLPTASPMKNQFHRHCAIVGNSGILLNSSCGPEIDSHDFVIRFWGFLICRGYVYGRPEVT